MSRTDRMASDLSRTGPVERDIEQVILVLIPILRGLSLYGCSLIVLMHMLVKFHLLEC